MSTHHTGEPTTAVRMREVEVQAAARARSEPDIDCTFAELFARISRGGETGDAALDAWRHHTQAILREYREKKR